MSFAIFKEFDKAPADLIADDFDSKYTLKIKSVGPAKTGLTTTITYTDKDGKVALTPKLSLKYPHESGFTLEKLEFDNKGSLAVETSLTNALAGLKLEFKGNDTDKADLSFKYVIPNATFTGEFDIHNLNKGDVSVSTGHGAFSGGVSAKFTSAKDDASSKVATNVSVGMGLAYAVPEVCFTALRAKDNFSSYSLLAQYTRVKDLTFAGSVDYCPKKTVGTLAGKFAYDKTTAFKAKATTEGVFSASIKKSFEANFAVVGSVEVPSNLKSVKWGVNATLG